MPKKAVIIIVTLTNWRYLPQTPSFSDLIGEKLILSA